jgi:hypothetical protein
VNELLKKPIRRYRTTNKTGEAVTGRRTSGDHPATCSSDVRQLPSTTNTTTLSYGAGLLSRIAPPQYAVILEVVMQPEWYDAARSRASDLPSPRHCPTGRFAHRSMCTAANRPASIHICPRLDADVRKCSKFTKMCSFSLTNEACQEIFPLLSLTHDMSGSFDK